MVEPQIPGCKLAESKRRLIVIDDNVRNVGGHFFELATLLMQGARRAGYQTLLATHKCFDQQAELEEVEVLPVFDTRRMVRWSLGVDGQSTLRRDETGRNVGGSLPTRLQQAFSDSKAALAKHPRQMLKQWKNAFKKVLAVTRPTDRDRLLINTGDDFVMLALCDALKEAKLPPLSVDVIFHFALVDPQQPDAGGRLSLIGSQVRNALDEVSQHDIRLHATTDALADQWRQTDVGKAIQAIPYPTRKPVQSAEWATSTEHSSSSEAATEESSAPIKAVLAGMPRAEKGSSQIRKLLQSIHSDHLSNGRFQVSMQMSRSRKRSLIPGILRSEFDLAISNPELKGASQSCLEIITSHLSTGAYHGWLNSADLGLFLYDPRRYFARCSGVLLEMMVRGVPVIVPDHCWLADQVRCAGGDGSIGFIYEHIEDIPGLLDRFAKQRVSMQRRARQYGEVIQTRHDPLNTITVMGLAQTVHAASAKAA